METTNTVGDKHDAVAQTKHFYRRPIVKINNECYKMLEDVTDFLSTWSHKFAPVVRGEAEAMTKKAYSILDKPPRNCDMGTPEEQHERFDKYCCEVGYCSKCPLFGEEGCEFKWAQMPYEPYEEGATDEQK